MVLFPDYPRRALKIEAAQNHEMIHRAAKFEFVYRQSLESQRYFINDGAFLNMISRKNKPRENAGSKVLIWI